MKGKVRVAVRLLGEDSLEVGVSLPLHLHYKFILRAGEIFLER